jgi:(E)-4-hydroxy-3-methylbut-2-enyl-diphosphate synthase
MNSETNNNFFNDQHKRKKTKIIEVGDIKIGGDSPITVQSMTNTKTTDIDATVSQIHELEKAGCDIVRVAVPNEEAASVLSSIKNQINIPLVADIHFQHGLALKAIDAGVDKIRINPGNIGDKKKIQQVLHKAMDNNIPVRIGVNSGSLERDLLEKYEKPCAQALVESALRHVRICEDFKFTDLIIALKASDVRMMIDANRLLSKEVDYPLHLGVTEAGSKEIGLVKSAIGIGTLLEQGIGDTIRVSLTANPVEEVKAGINILKTLSLKQQGVTIISCPTCGRLEYNMFSVVDEIEKRVALHKKPITIAIMGCVVNGPGEAREADIGIAGGKGKVVLFKKGKVLKTVKEERIVEVLMSEINNL